jgi:hypothetical protein
VHGSAFTSMLAILSRQLKVLGTALCSAGARRHSILRLGLKNVSGTKMMTAGQAHGAGIYTAPHMSTSVGYCRNHVGGKRGGAAGGSGRGGGGGAGGSMFLEGSITCMAICEIIDATICGKPTIKRSGGIWVIEDDDYINTVREGRGGLG